MSVQIDQDTLLCYIEAYQDYFQGVNDTPFAALMVDGFPTIDEDYKKRNYERNHGKLFDKENHMIVTQSEIQEVVSSCVEDSDNLVNPHQKKHFFVRVNEEPTEAGFVLWQIYSGDAETAFQAATKFFGRKYDLISYLFFLRDSDLYMPLRPTFMDKWFRRPNIVFTTSYQCSWKNYTEYNHCLKGIAESLRAFYSNEKITLIDAHSFVWQMYAFEEIERYTRQDTPLVSGAKDRMQIIKARVSQAVFRKRQIKYWGGKCSVTGFDNVELLEACHIKPWNVCDESLGEHLSLYNGLLLRPDLHAAFDAGYISFDDSGKILISKRLKKKQQTLLGITPDMRLRMIAEANMPFLEYHRAKVFR